MGTRLRDWWWREKFVYQRNLFPDSEFTRFLDVKSCFGGITFYKSLQSIADSGCQYVHFADMIVMAEPNAYNSSFVVQHFRRHPTRVLEKDTTCEHIPFNLCLYNNGMRSAISRRSELLTPDRHPYSKPRKKHTI